MKYVILASLLLHTLSLSAQTEKPASVETSTAKSATPLATQNSKPKTQNSTRAVVIGISDYQDPAIPDLRYAHRNAEAFAAWLRSPAGGSVPNENLNMLLNQKATVGRCAQALDQLLSECRAGDQAIIYFAGYADVEKMTRMQSGYLLFYDAPASVYMAGGALPLPFLQDFIATLSGENKAGVLLIADACHAGNLIGNSIGGRQITATNLAMQYANEVKILSCQPHEVSLEGEQWGGGRSAFSWRLLEGLYGLADRDDDGLITAFEIGDYLERTVPDDAAPAQQTPIVIGNRKSVLSCTDPALSAVLRHQRRAETPGLECIPCAEFYRDLEQALRDKSDTLDWLLREPGLTPFGEIPKVQALVKQYAPGVSKD